MRGTIHGRERPIVAERRRWAAASEFHRPNGENRPGADICRVRTLSFERPLSRCMCNVVPPQCRRVSMSIQNTRFRGYVARLHNLDGLIAFFMLRPDGLEDLLGVPGKHPVGRPGDHAESPDLFDHPVEQCLLGPVARVAPSRRDEGGKSVRLRARLDSEHPPDWSAPTSRAQWPIGASRCRSCPCPCERRSRKVGRSASNRCRRQCA